MKTANKKIYNYSNNVVNGNLCKECLQDKHCTNNRCPVYKWRSDKDTEGSKLQSKVNSILGE